MATLACLLPLLAAIQVASDLPRGGRVEITLVTDRETYHVGEPVRLTLTVHNVGEGPLFGYMRLAPYLPLPLRTASLLYCHRSAPCVEFLSAPPESEERCLAIASQKLAAGARERSEFVMALNPATGRPVLEVPGDYELRWVTRGIHEQQGNSTGVRGMEIGASALIRVLPVPTSEEEPFVFYRENHLGTLAQLDLTYFVDKPALRDAGRAMLRRYPDSIYTTAIRNGLLELLESRNRGGRATPEELALIAELRGRRFDR